MPERLVMIYGASHQCLNPLLVIPATEKGRGITLTNDSFYLPFYGFSPPLKSVRCSVE